MASVLLPSENTNQYIPAFLLQGKLFLWKSIVLETNGYISHFPDLRSSWCIKSTMLMSFSKMLFLQLQVFVWFELRHYTSINEQAVGWYSNQADIVINGKITLGNTWPFARTCHNNGVLIDYYFCPLINLMHIV